MKACGNTKTIHRCLLTQEKEKMNINRKKIRNEVPEGWLIIWEGIERQGSVVKHTIIRNEKTSIELFLYNFDVPVYESKNHVCHPICGCKAENFRKK